MGCTTSLPDQMNPSATLKLLEHQFDVLEKQKTLDIRGITLLIWKSRERPDLGELLINLMASRAYERDVFNGIEFYLPQLVHMLVHLEVNWPTAVLEHFALFVAQQSVHLALQVCWTLIGHMEDYQAETDDGERNPSANPVLYYRCATLLEKLEVAVVFGSPQCNEFEKLYRAGSITRAELMELENADRKFQAMRISADVEENAGFDMDGKLKYKRWKTRGMFHQDAWISRRFVICHRVLFCLRAGDNALKRSIPLQYCNIVIPNKNEYNEKFYFEIHEQERERKYLLVADSQAEMDKWIAALKKAINSPPSTPKMHVAGKANIDISSLTPAQIARYGFFRSEREFVRDLTDLCEELRFVDVKDRKAKLRQRLPEINIPGCVYLPLCASTDTWERVVKVVPDKSFAFSTRERCPCLMTFETTCDDPEYGLDTATYLYQTLGFDDSNTDLGEEDIVQLENAESLQSQRAAMRERFVHAARNSVTKLDLDLGDLRKELAEEGNAKGNCKSDGTNPMLSDLPHLWEDDTPEQNVAQETDTAEDGTKVQVASHDAARKHLKAEVLKVQAIEIFTKQKLPREEVKLINSESPQKSRGKFLVALGKYMSTPESAEDDAEKATDTPKLQNRRESIMSLGQLIAKSNDDLRQEVFIMQLIQFLHDIWADKGLALQCNPYRIMSTSQTCGLIEVVSDSNSIDGVKKDNDLKPMVEIFKQLFPETHQFEQAQKNYVESMAAYSLITYILGIKDRHNGNIMLNLKTGAITHIDFGFVLGMAPGKDKIKHTNFSMERAAFKLTPELVDVMGGKKSDNWKYFNKLLCDGLLEARRHADTLVTLAEIMGYKSKLPCFNQPGGGTTRVVRELKERLMVDLTDSMVVAKMNKLANKASTSRGSIIYEKFQRFSNGIAPVL